MLAQEVAARHPGRVRFVEENFGESALAERFGVEQYPAIFVDDALVAGPWDFFEWPNTPKGRYVPFLERENRDRFASDLETFVERRLAGEELSLPAAPRPKGPPRLASLPSFQATTLEGRAISDQTLAGKLVVVEFWATWCPPCRSTLSFLSELQSKHPDEMAVVPVAVSSKEEDVRALLDERADGGVPSSVVMGSEDLVSRFGGVLAVPTLFVFGPDGKAQAVFYGAPPDLHERVSALLSGLVEKR